MLWIAKDFVHVISKEIFIEAPSSSQNQLDYKNWFYKNNGRIILDETQKLKNCYNINFS